MAELNNLIHGVRSNRKMAFGRYRKIQAGLKHGEKDYSIMELMQINACTELSACAPMCARRFWPQLDGKLVGCVPLTDTRQDHRSRSRTAFAKLFRKRTTDRSS
jgi:hypothetical protein